jgi:hypothetical protein
MLEEKSEHRVVEKLHAALNGKLDGYLRTESPVVH